MVEVVASTKKWQSYYVIVGQKVQLEYQEIDFLYQEVAKSLTSGHQKKN